MPNVIVPEEEVIMSIKGLYDFEIIDCKFNGKSFHDNYFITTNKGNYFLRIYKPNIRSVRDILYELDFLNFLYSQGLNVSYPILKKDGTIVTEIIKEELNRVMVLFSFAAGNYPNPTEETSHLYGKYMASFHNIAEKFTSIHERSYKFDIDYIINQSLEIIRPALSYRPEDLNYFENLSEIMKKKINHLPLAELTWASCHGDLHFMNLYIDKKDITLFDFDCCAPGYLAYDLGTIRWEFAFTDDLWTLFLDGYTKVREVNNTELSAIPMFATIRNLWVISHNIKYSDIYEVNDEFWDINMYHIQKWNKKNNYM